MRESKNFVWSTSARLELRRIDRETAMRILTALTRYAKTGEGAGGKILRDSSPPGWRLARPLSSCRWLNLCPCYREPRRGILNEFVTHG